MAAEPLAYVHAGTRTISCTAWPIYHEVHQGLRRGTWVLLTWVCNGTAEGSETFRSRTAALDALDRLRPPK